MKRFALICVLAGVLGVGVAAARNDVPADGTLTVKNGNGNIVVTGRGVVIGRFDRGFVTIKDPNPDDGPPPIVTGAEVSRDLNDTTTRYGGTNIRFRIIGGAFDIRINATNIDLSVVGRGTARLAGSGTLDDGTYSVNGGSAQPFPFFPVVVQIKSPPPQQQQQQQNGG